MQRIVAPGKKAAKKYLTNKELLKQIHLSKKTYCWFKDDKYSDYDIILPSLDKINIRTTKQAKDIRKAKLEAQDPPIKVPDKELKNHVIYSCLLYTSPSPRDGLLSRMPSSA